jgi:hypothetical protein
MLTQDHKQVLFEREEDFKLTAMTPSESGLDLSTLILALESIRDNAEHPDRLTVIFEDEQASWTVQQVGFDKTWVRLS